MRFCPKNAPKMLKIRENAPNFSKMRQNFFNFLKMRQKLPKYFGNVSKSASIETPILSSQRTTRTMCLHLPKSLNENKSTL